MCDIIAIHVDLLYCIPLLQISNTKYFNIGFGSYRENRVEGGGGFNQFFWKKHQIDYSVMLY